MLAFNEAHEGKKTRTEIGEWEGPPGVEGFRPIPPVFTNYVQWKEGWVKYRTDKVVGMSEVDARRIVAGLRGK